MSEFPLFPTEVFVIGRVAGEYYRATKEGFKGRFLPFFFSRLTRWLDLPSKIIRDEQQIAVECPERLCDLRTDDESLDEAESLLSYAEVVSDSPPIVHTWDWIRGGRRVTLKLDATFLQDYLMEAIEKECTISDLDAFNYCFYKTVDEYVNGFNALGGIMSKSDLIEELVGSDFEDKPKRICGRLAAIARDSTSVENCPSMLDVFNVGYSVGALVQHARSLRQLLQLHQADKGHTFQDDCDAFAEQVAVDVQSLLGEKKPLVRIFPEATRFLSRYDLLAFDPESDLLSIFDELEQFRADFESVFASVLSNLDPFDVACRELDAGRPFPRSTCLSKSVIESPVGNLVYAQRRLAELRKVSPKSAMSGGLDALEPIVDDVFPGFFSNGKGFRGVLNDLINHAKSKDANGQFRCSTLERRFIHLADQIALGVDRNTLTHKINSPELEIIDSQVFAFNHNLTTLITWSDQIKLERKRGKGQKKPA